MTTPKPVVLCILDGWGIREADAANAPALANTRILIVSCRVRRRS